MFPPRSWCAGICVCGWLSLSFSLSFSQTSLNHLTSLSLSLVRQANNMQCHLQSFLISSPSPLLIAYMSVKAHALQLPQMILDCCFCCRGLLMFVSRAIAPQSFHCLWLLSQLFFFFPLSYLCHITSMKDKRKLVEIKETWRRGKGEQGRCKFGDNHSACNEIRS